MKKITLPNKTRRKESQEEILNILAEAEKAGYLTIENMGE